jgi:hypothetical protein
MNVTDWNAIADAYSDVDDPAGRAVLAFVREKLTTLQPKRLLDYGGGDGKFAVLCAESLSLQEIVTYPAPRMTSLARSLCAGFNVAIYDGKRELHIVDAHWSLTAMSSQLNESGFVIENLYELPRSTSGSSEHDASLWLVIVARKL